MGRHHRNRWYELLQKQRFKGAERDPVETNINLYFIKNGGRTGTFEVRHHARVADSDAGVSPPSLLILASTPRASYKHPGRQPMDLQHAAGHDITCFFLFIAKPIRSPCDFHKNISNGICAFPLCRKSWAWGGGRGGGRGGGKGDCPIYPRCLG